MTEAPCPECGEIMLVLGFGPVPRGYCYNCERIKEHNAAVLSGPLPDAKHEPEF